MDQHMLLPLDQYEPVDYLDDLEVLSDPDIHWQHRKKPFLFIAS